ncbi:MAG TPA: single-stranded-DNA-specific exonuclease RecJ [Steroidobacteraceae bacterium]|nr:single-stranded-DNA-specific exonuclease RecJ [Steroidobacteraceae bacterium]
MSRRILRRAIDEQALPASATPLHPAVRRVYAARGVHCDEDLDLSMERLLPVGSLGGVDAAVDLLLACHRTGGKVLVVGDFDADGATSTAVVVRQLRRLGFVDPGFLVPDRFKYGYGLTPEIVRVAAQMRPALIVTVDNGISSLEGVAEARREGIPVLVTDHHLPGAALPDAAAIVNPNAPGERFASKALAGVGVAFYVVAALTRRMRESGLVGKAADVNAADLLDLVALGTVADVVPLDLNNRVLVAQGLRRIRAGRCAAGLRALLESAGRRLETVIAQDLGFQAGPRLNAAGRLEDMSLGIECLLTAEAAEARELASRLAQLNSERREIEHRMQQEALAKVDELVASLEGGMPAGLCLYDAGWHQGVIGLVASRVKERVHRPVIAFAPGDPGWVKGSARSVPGVHVRDALDAVATRNPGLLEKFGGHAMAAGMTLRAARLAEFGQAFADEIARRIDEDTLTGDLHTDGPLLPGEFNADTAIALREAGPWGSGFPEPSFDGCFGVVTARIVGDRHLKLRLKAGSGEAVDSIAFRYLDDADAAPVRAGQDVEIVYRTALDEYGGARRMQLVSEWLRTLP